MSVDYHQVDAQDLLSGHTSDSDYFSELNSAKSNRGGQRSSSLPEPKVPSYGVSDILPFETFMATKRLSFAEIDNVLKVGVLKFVFLYCIYLYCLFLVDHSLKYIALELKYTLGSQQYKCLHFHNTMEYNTISSG